MSGRRIATYGLVAIVGALGTAALARSLGRLPDWFGWWPLVLILVAAGLELLKVDLFTYHAAPTGAGQSGQQVAVTAGQAATFLILVIYGADAAVVAAVLQAVVTGVVNRTVWFKALFNFGLFAGATFLTGLVYVTLGGTAAGWGIGVVIALVASAGCYFLVQSGCVALAVGVSTGRPFWRVWLDSIGWMAVQQVILGLFGLLLGRFMLSGLTLLGALLLGSPLMLLRYSYKRFGDRIAAYVRQIEDANRDLGLLNLELRATNDELILTLGTILDARDRYTYGHSTQVARYAMALGEKLGLSGPELEKLRQAALLHDIGKVGIPEAVLRKPGPLEPDERLIMQAHAEIGYRITRQVHSLAPVADIIRQHHEWVGGGGYPLGLKGDQILIPARIIGVADALETMVSDRPYRKGRPVEVAVQELRRCSGTQFDPAVVVALEALVRERGGLWFRNSALDVGESLLAAEVAASMAAVSQA